MEERDLVVAKSLAQEPGCLEVRLTLAVGKLHDRIFKVVLTREQSPTSLMSESDTSLRFNVLRRVSVDVQ